MVARLALSTCQHCSWLAIETKDRERVWKGRMLFWPSLSLSLNFHLAYGESSSWPMDRLSLMFSIMSSILDSSHKDARSSILVALFPGL